MSAMTFSTTQELGGHAALVDRLRGKSGPIATVIAVHALLFYMVSSGLLSRVVQIAMPDPVMVTFVTPAPPPPPVPPAAPKLASLTPPPPVVVVPLTQLQIAPVEQAITPTPPAAQVERAPAAVVVAAAAPAVGNTGPKTITTGVEYIQPPQPVYPSQSRRMGEQGKVVLRVLVNEKGTADQVVVQSSSGSARLDEAGRQAALRALFKPHLEDGRAVPVFVIVPLNFQLAS
jgi:protein TonB